MSTPFNSVARVTSIVFDGAFGSEPTLSGASILKSPHQNIWLVRYGDVSRIPWVFDAYDDAMAHLVSENVKGQRAMGVAEADITSPHSIRPGEESGASSTEPATGDAAA